MEIYLSNNICLYVYMFIYTYKYIYMYIYIYIYYKQNQHILGEKNNARIIEKINKSSCVIFCTKMVRCLQIMYYQETRKAFSSHPTRFLLPSTLSAKVDSIFLIFWQGPILPFCYMPYCRY